MVKCYRVTKFLKENDYFAIPISFRYKEEDKYSTLLGGIMTVLFALTYITFGIFYFIPFIKKEDFTLYSNTINLPYADSVLLDSYNSFFEVGLQCGNETEKELYKYLEIKAKYYLKETNNNGTITRQKDEINLVNINNSNLLYIDNLNRIIKGRYGDPEFQYIEISLNSKKKLVNILEKLMKYYLKLIVN